MRKLPVHILSMALIPLFLGMLALPAAQAWVQQNAVGMVEELPSFPEEEKEASEYETAVFQNDFREIFATLLQSMERMRLISDDQFQPEIPVPPPR